MHTGKLFAQLTEYLPLTTFRRCKEIIVTEFRTRSELNQPYVWKPPMISEVDMPARVLNGVMIPAHRELVIVRPGHWVRTENLLESK